MACILYDSLGFLTKRFLAKRFLTKRFLTKGFLTKTSIQISIFDPNLTKKADF